jgi:GPI mannosyltransferase 2
VQCSDSLDLLVRSITLLVWDRSKKLRRLTSSRNVGLFRYWSLSNAPLFALAAPALVVLIVSAYYGLGMGRQMSSFSKHSEVRETRLLAAPQLLLAVLALTTYHVQIITRISSGYPLWYIWLATVNCVGKNEKLLRATIYWMVIYALVQAGLYASFLPPA